MEIQRRSGHDVLYLSTHGQAIRIPPGTPRERITLALKNLPPTSHDRRKRAIAALNLAGIAAT